jgi:RNA polymerase sigma-70 factor, ECF subfamily
MKALAHEEELLQESYQGSSRAFKKIVEHYQGIVSKTIYGMIGSGPEAEDIGQMVFIQLHKNLGKFRGDSSLGTYLCRIAINLCKNHYRRKSLWQRLGFGTIHDEIEDTSSEDLSLKHEVNKVLSKLSPKYREVLVLRYLDGFPIKDVAATLDIPLGTALSRLSRAEKQLKEYWQSHTKYHELLDGSLSFSFNG